MKTKLLSVFLLTASLLTAPNAITAQTPVGTAFTYQGQLKKDGILVTDSCDFEFSLWDDPAGGGEVGDSPQAVSGLSVEDGVFIVTLDFGTGVFIGEVRWLGMQVCCPSGECTLEPLTSRQELTPGPYAIRAGTGVGGPTALNVDANDNVGIGTTTPTAKLEIAGTAGVDGIKFPDGSVQTTAATGGLWTQAGGDVFYTVGSVGIGTAGPFSTAGDGSIDDMFPAALPSSSAFLACVWSSATERAYCFGPGAQIVEYNPANNTVSIMNAVLPLPSYGLACAEEGSTGKIYCFGGRGGTTDLDEIVVFYPLYPYVPNEPLAVVAHLPGGRRHLACAWSDVTGMIYCFGGQPQTDQILQYDPGAPNVDPTDTGARLPTARYNLACVPGFGTGKIYCFGGLMINGPVVFFDDILEYDPVNPGGDPAVISAALPSAREGLACAADGTTEKIYCFGGEHGTGDLDEIAEYKPGTNIVPTMDVRLPTPKSYLSCAADPSTGYIYCFGGQVYGPHVREILRYIPHVRTALLQVGDPGDGTGAIANTWSVFSSRAFKRDISPLDRVDYQDILDKLKTTDVVRYRYAGDARQTLHLGVIAEDSPAEILSPGGKAVSLGDYTGFLMAAIKSQQSVIEEQERVIADVQVRLERVEAKLSESVRMPLRQGRRRYSEKGGGR